MFRLKSSILLDMHVFTFCIAIPFEHVRVYKKDLEIWVAGHLVIKETS